MPRKPTGALISAEDAARLLANNPALAEARAREILEQKPGNRTALLLLGAALRRQGRSLAAKAVLKPLVDRLPQYAIAQFELGLALADVGESSDAVAAFLQVVDFNSGFMEAWYELGDYSTLLSRSDGGSKPPADEELPKPDLRLKQSELALGAGRLDVAERLLRELLAVCPTDAGATKLLADTLLRAGRLADAEVLLAQSVALAPNFVAARFRYATVLLASLDFEEALRQADELLRQEPANALFHYLRAILFVRIDAFDQAIPEYEAVLKDGPHRAGVWIGYAHALKALGRDRQCIAALKEAIDLVPSLGVAYQQLASVKTFRFEPAMVDALRSQL
jgi:predicted Zn-dependent protease